MKCDELIMCNCETIKSQGGWFYEKDAVDEAIAELKEFVQDAEYFKNLAESYHKRWLNAKIELDAYKVKEAQNEM